MESEDDFINFCAGWKKDGVPDFKELVIGLFDKLAIDKLCRNGHFDSATMFDGNLTLSSSV